MLLISGCQTVSEVNPAARSPETIPAAEIPVLEDREEDEAREFRGQSVDEDPSVAAMPGEEPPIAPPAGAALGRLLGLPALGDLLDDSSDDAAAVFRSAPTSPEPDIRSPGPDTANFGNSPYTLPQGRAYIEASPVFLSGPSQGSAKTYNAEFLLRYGLTDRMELRLFSNGPTAERGRFAANGMAPLAWDIKTNLWKENRDYHIPAVGLEVFILTPSGSKGLNQGTQPSITLLFHHTLPLGFALEWNVGMVGDPSPNNNFSSIEPAAAWSLTHRLTKNIDFYHQGYFNGPTLPRYADGVVLGGGISWAATKRFSLFSSYSAGVSKAAPTTIFYLGGALRFEHWPERLPLRTRCGACSPI